MAEVNLVKVVTTDTLDEIITTEDAAVEANNSIHESREDLEDNESDLADFEDSDLTDWEDDEDDDNDEDDEKPEEPWICERRHSGDGEEQPERANENKLDDDEDKKNPAYIPRKGTFFEHDLRHGCEEEGAVESEKSGIGEASSRPNKMLWCWDKAKWEHDKFDERSQRPKSCKEIVAAYGFDIRTDKNKNTDGRTATARPRGRRVDQKSRLGEFIQQRRVISSSLYFGRSGRKQPSVKNTRGTSVDESEKPNEESKKHEKSAKSEEVVEVREAGRSFESAYRKSRGERKEDRMHDGKTDEENNQENIYVWRRCGDRGRANEGGRSGARSGNVVSRITRGSRFRAGSGRIGGMSRFSEENHRHPDKLARVTTSNGNSGRRSISGVRKNSVGRSVKKNLVVASSKLKTDVPDASYREKESNNKVDKGKENEMQKLEKSFSQIRTSAVSKSQDVRLIVLYDTSEPDVCREGRRVEISNRSENKKKRNRVIIQTTMTPDILPPMTCIQTNAKSSDSVVSQKQQPATSTVSSGTDGSVISSDSSHQAITSTTHSSKLNPSAQYFCHSKRYSSQRQKTGIHEYRHPAESKQQPASLVMQASAAQSMFATEHVRFYSQQIISGSNLVPSSIVPISFAPPASLFAPRLSSPFIRPSRVIGFGCPPMAFSYQMPLTSSSSPPKTMPYQMPLPPSSSSSTTTLPLQYPSSQFASNSCLPAPSVDHSVCPIEVRGGTVYFSPENQPPPKKSLGKTVYFDVEQQSATISRPTLEKRPKAAIAIIDPKSMKDLTLDVGGIESDKNIATTDNGDATNVDINVLSTAGDTASIAVDFNDLTTAAADMDNVTAVVDNVDDTGAVAADDNKSLVNTNTGDIATIAINDSAMISAPADDIVTVTVDDPGMTSAPCDDNVTVAVDDPGMTSAPCDDIVDAVIDSDVPINPS